MNKILYIIVISLLLTSCYSSKKKIEVSCKEINEDVFIRLNKGKVISIDYPFGIDLKNVSNKNISFSSIAYWENDIKSFKASLLYKKEKNALIEISKTEYKQIKSLDNDIYILYTQQAIDSTKAVQQLFEKYIKKDNIRNKINIGNIKDFNKENSALINKMTIGDSLHIRIKYDKKIENIKIPVNY
ncbi:hypothetical protein A8C32_03965 [Flavivirga aquatica]|uniref:Lipoprotein n=1 Tax=Flavivirga aquatica TaxID=1849968 RepID=A0A1E5TB59_9FLAO|nr:hypothetical protein [Flavivirga aquatica]OEK08614.1 hypothetical protein A8C32_03965 [Flavivirga aquatica]